MPDYRALKNAINRLEEASLRHAKAEEALTRQLKRLDTSKDRKQRLRESVYRLGYTLYAKNLVTGDGRAILKGKPIRTLVFEKYEVLRTMLYKEYGQMW